ncbi:MAG: hypothetical protein FGM54_08435 [Chitinophagaceae bacterium]|nr:hypothetical protein [Chitinophagaceae bacterium]
MKKPNENSIIFDKRAGIIYSSLAQIVLDVYNEFDRKEVKWPNHGHVEIGFYIKDKNSKTSIFFGVWYDVWAQFGTPLCIAIFYDGNMYIEKHLKFIKFIESKLSKSSIVKEYDNHSVLLLEETFFNTENEVHEIYKLLMDLKEFYDIKNK